LARSALLHFFEKSMDCNLSRNWRWYDVPPVPVTDPLHSWLTSRDSLTRRLCAICEEFQVVVHQSRFQRVCPDETFLLSVGKDAQGTATLVREVSLVCDGIPLVFGHSFLMTRKPGPLAQSFRHAGNNSLGAILFAYPDIQRGPLHFKRINREHALYAKSVAAFGDVPMAFFFARRSVFSLRLEQVCVTEVFSPRLVTFSLEAVA
jgi:chorismate--pyruvate lyase